MQRMTLTYSPIKAGEIKPDMEGKAFIADIQTYKCMQFIKEENAFRQENVRTKCMN